MKPIQTKHELQFDIFGELPPNLRWTFTSGPLLLRRSSF